VLLNAICGPLAACWGFCLMSRVGRGADGTCVALGTCAAHPLCYSVGDA